MYQDSRKVGKQKSKSHGKMDNFDLVRLVLMELQNKIQKEKIIMIEYQ